MTEVKKPRKKTMVMPARIQAEKKTGIANKNKARRKEVPASAANAETGAERVHIDN